jgi:hypothetical protein
MMHCCQAVLSRYLARRLLFQTSSNQGGTSESRRTNLLGMRLELVL